MSGAENIRLGPLTAMICAESSWRGKDHFPSSQAWADDVERVLSFLQIEGQFERYLPMLRGKLNQRDGALAEARVGFFFQRNGFQILSWEPAGDAGKTGEFEVQWRDTDPMFVEVKGPRWEGELASDEKTGPRRQGPKYVNGEARNLDSVGKVIDCMKKAGPKFLPDKPNLLVVAGYLLFVSPRLLKANIILPQLESALSKPVFSRIGGVAIFDVFCRGSSVEYQMVFQENPAASTECSLPDTVTKGLKEGNRRGFRC